MMRKTLLLLALFAASAGAAPPPAVAPVEIVSAEFGLFDGSRPGELVFEPTAVVPHKVGQRYGWVIEVRTAKRSLAVREEYLLPLPSRADETADPVAQSLNLPAERRSQVSQRQLVPVDGRIYGEWSIGPGEPPGRRRLQVLIENRTAATFDYAVE
jgi:hypothetical protein